MREMLVAASVECSTCILFSTIRADPPHISALPMMRSSISANRSPFSPSLLSSKSNFAISMLRCSSSNNKVAVRPLCEHQKAFASSHRSSDTVCMSLGQAFGGLSGDAPCRKSRIRVSDDPFPMEDAIDDSLESALDYLDNAADMISEVEPGVSALSTIDRGGKLALFEGVEATRRVDYKIDEDEFHKINLHQCDFFIRKVPDKDNDVYDFREMYVTPTDTDIYSRPTIVGKMPTKPMRCTKSSWEAIYVAELPLDQPRAPYYMSEERALKVFLMKHYKNKRVTAENFVLNFEQIYVIDAKTKSITRAKVTVTVPGGKDRDRKKDVLIVQNGGTSFRVIPKEKRKSPDEILGSLYWKETRETMQNFLRGFRDYERSNWF
ncbi:hypothetical protein O6H91_02G055400 [Diphasiastrum complanatum]|uniref:Uncharacterized protein n=1 Tax=Diphasiastrum complanatum TaxID=34168 RepID=A0ACC2EFM2_DIPCM|nr:hypothetical protein O6H91_02G055400 [Diphasiastrum complanatum]